MAKKHPPLKGKVISYDKGKFQLRVAWKQTKGGDFLFCPYVVVSNGGFTKDHTAVFSWKDHLKSDFDKYGTKELWENKNSTVFEKQERTVKYERNVHQSGTYYAKRYSKKSKKTKTVKEKYVTKKHKLSTHKVKESIDTKGHWFTNYDGYVTIKCTIGKVVSQVTLDKRGKPSKPDKLTAWLNEDVDTHTVVKVGVVPAKGTAPVRSLTLYRMDDSETEGAYRPIGDAKFFGNPDSGGDINGIKNVEFHDNTTQSGHRYMYKVTARNPKDSNTGVSNTTGWYYTRPPAVSDVTHERLSDLGETSNAIRFTRSDSDVEHDYYKGFLVQFSNSLRTDPVSEQTWNNVPSSNIEFYSPTNPNKTVSWNWLSTEWFENPQKKTGRHAVGNHILFRHTGCQPDRSYRYRIRPWNYWNGQNGEIRYTTDAYPSLDGTDVTYNEPYEPESVKATFNVSTGFVDLEVTRKMPYTTADKMFIQRKEGDDGEWTDVPSGSGTDGTPITPKTIPGEDYDDRKYTYTDEEVASGSSNTVKYRVALACSKTPADGTELRTGNGKSKWTESNEVIATSKPNPATLTMPINNSFALIEDGTIRFAWIHSPTDGTEQEAAKIQYTLTDDFENATEISVERVSYYDLDISGFSSRSSIKWRVSTKGKHPTYSDWSEPFEFKLYTKPSLNWLTPSNAADISNLPLQLSWEYSDDSGTLSELVLHIQQGEAILAEYNLDPTLSEGIGAHDLKEYLFDDGETYQLTLISKSSVGLSASSTISIKVNYISIDLEAGFEPNAMFDEDTGYAYVTLNSKMTAEEEAESTIAIDEATQEESGELDGDDTSTITPVTTSSSPIKMMYLYRESGNEQVLLETITIDGPPAESYEFMDPYAPVNTDFQYKVLQITENGEVAISESTIRFQTLWWYIYYGDDGIVKTRWNPSGSAQFRRPEKQQIRYSGREYPVTYDSNANEETYSFSTTLFRDYDDGRDVLEQFKDMIRAGGSGIWKSFEGDVYPADFDFSYTADYTDGLPSWQCSLNVTRIDTEEAL